MPDYRLARTIKDRNSVSDDVSSQGGKEWLTLSTIAH
jgi:hypothetical protein